MSRNLIVYLDSSDFSTLSQTITLKSDFEVIKRNLIDLSQSQRVTFAYSGIHLGEMAPLEPFHAMYADERTSFLVTLCHRNALVSVDRLLEIETSNLKSGTRKNDQVLTRDGTWFPEVHGFFHTIKPGKMEDQVIDEIRDLLPNRNARRKLKNHLSNESKRSLIKNQIAHFANEQKDTSITNIMEQYPMRVEDAAIIQRYLWGKATSLEAEAALLASLRDPSWMMKWFSNHHSRLSPFLQFVRKNSIEMTEVIRENMARLSNLRRSGDGSAEKYLFYESWAAEQDKLVVGVVGRLMKDLPASIQLNAALVDAMCPGLSCMIRTWHSVARDSLITKSRNPKESDAVDAMHAMYAPYCDIFRADRYMAPHIQRQVESKGIIVVSKLLDLPHVIEQRLRTY